MEFPQTGMSFSPIGMGICWSDPPSPPIRSQPPTPMRPCLACGTWTKSPDYCEMCLQKNAMRYIAPSAPPMQQPQYSYQVAYPQPQMYTYAQPRPPYYPPQQQQMGTGTAMATGFVIGALMEDILDPTD